MGSLNVAGVYAAAFSPGLNPIGNPGPGCTSVNDDNTSSTSGSVGLIASGGTSSQNKHAETTCNPTYNNKQVNQNTYDRSTTVDNNTVIMTKNSLTAISNSTNPSESLSSRMVVPDSVNFIFVK